MEEQTNTEASDEIEDLELDDASAEDIGGGLGGDDPGWLTTGFAESGKKADRSGGLRG